MLEGRRRRVDRANVKSTAALDHGLNRTDAWYSGYLRSLNNIHVCNLLSLVHPSNASPFPPPLPELPSTIPLSFPSAPSAFDPPVVNRHSSRNEPNNNQRLHRFCKDRPRQKKQTNTTKDDRCADPCLVRSFQIRFPHPQDNQTQYRYKVESISAHTVESDQGTKFTHEHVTCRERRVKDHGIYGRKAELALISYQLDDSVIQP